MSRNTAAPESPGNRRMLPVEIYVLSGAAFLSPLIAGKLEPLGPAVVRILALFAALILLARARRNGSVEFPAGWVVWLSAALFLIAAASAVRSVSVHATLFALLNLAGYLLLFLVTASLASRHRMVYQVLAALLVSAIVVSALGLKEYLLSPFPGWRTFSTFFNPDFLAGFMVIVLPIALAWYLSDTSVGISLAAGVAALGAFSSLLMTASRFGLASAIGGLLIFGGLALASGSARRQQLMKVALLLVPVVLVFLACGRPVTVRVAAVQAESHSAGFRIETWKGTMRMADAHPVLGTGLGTFQLEYPRYASVGWTKLAHNSYLQLAAESGIMAPVALIVLLGSAVAALAAFVCSRSRDRGVSEPGHAKAREWMPHPRLMVSGILGGVAASAARNLIDSDWYVAGIAIPFSIVLGAGVALASRKPTHRLTLSRARFWMSAVLLIAAILISLVAIIAQNYAAIGDSLLRDGDAHEATRVYGYAALLDPLNADYCRALGAATVLEAQGVGDSTQFHTAERWMLKAIRLEPTSAKAYYQLGRLYALAMEDLKAAGAYREALARDPNSMQVLLSLARTYERLAREPDALAIYRRITRIEDSKHERIKAIPEYVESAYVFAHYALGKQLERRGDGAGAVRHYHLALDQAERFRESVNAMAAILEASGKRDWERESEVEAVAADIRQRLRVPGR